MKTKKNKAFVEKFIIKHYIGDKHPTVKGNGFDGLIIGDNRDEAEEFVNFINAIIEKVING